MTAASAWLIAAALAQGAIAFVLLGMLGAIRVPLVSTGTIKAEQVALSRAAWPDHEKKVANAFDNQFQLPVLFYVGCGLALYFGVTWFEVVLAWLFVASRVVHAMVFVTHNRVAHRFWAYTIGFGLLLALWLNLAIRLISIAVGGR